MISFELMPFYIFTAALPILSKNAKRIQVMSVLSRELVTVVEPVQVVPALQVRE